MRNFISKYYIAISIMIILVGCSLQGYFVIEKLGDKVEKEGGMGDKMNNNERIEKAQEALKSGDKELAEELFYLFIKEQEDMVAFAAFQSGQLAEGRVDYEKALKNYKQAVVLQPENQEHRTAYVKMAKKLKVDDPSMEWLAE